MARIIIPSGSPGLRPIEKNRAVPARVTIIPIVCKRLGISRSQRMPPKRMSSVIMPIMNETVMAGRYFNDQNIAPLPMV